jgi:energy-coupling factor transporter transmembrane protein EcfT
MHPVIRIVSLIVLAVALGRGGLGELVLGVLVLAALYLVLGVRDLAPLATMLRRLRWLLGSLLVIYLWFTPGERLWEVLGVWSPTREGLQLGLLRVGLLLVLVSGVNLLLQCSRREELLAGVYWLAAPLRSVGVSRERLALRMVLVLETVPQLRPLVAKESSAGTSQAGRRGGLGRLADTAAKLFGAALQQAERAPLRAVQIPDPVPPPLREWLYPLSLGLLLWGAGAVLAP